MAGALKFGSLFSGIGGFDLGFERAGMTCEWQCEFDPHASSVLANRWPNVQRFEDVRYLDGNASHPVDVLCGGSPCQDVSVAGRRAGLAGERSGLFFEFMRILGEAQPEWVVIENVPGLLSSAGGRDMAAVVGALEELGYGWAYRVLDAQYFGVAQRRRRVFIVGCAGGRTSRAVQVLFESESLRGDSPPSRATGEEAAGSLGARVRNDFDSSGAYVVAGVAAFDERNITSKTNRSTVEAGRPAPTLHSGGLSVALLPETTGTTTANWWKGPGNTQVEMGAVQPIGGGVRRLTPTECERLQGFPDGWTAGQADTNRYKQLGNAVAVPVAEWLARRIVSVNA